MARFVLNRHLERDLERELAYKRGLHEKAEEAARNAKAVAPVLTGAYRDSIQATEEGGEVFVVAKDWKANFIEFGTVNNPPKAPLRRGVQAAGLRFKASRK